MSAHSTLHPASFEEKTVIAEKGHYGLIDPIRVGAITDVWASLISKQNSSTYIQNLLRIFVLLDHRLHSCQITAHSLKIFYKILYKA